MAAQSLFRLILKGFVKRVNRRVPIRTLKFLAFHYDARHGSVG